MLKCPFCYKKSQNLQRRLNALIIEDSLVNMSCNSILEDYFVNLASLLLFLFIRLAYLVYFNIILIAYLLLI